jgi:hypothetical protein
MASYLRLLSLFVILLLVGCNANEGIRNNKTRIELIRVLVTKHQEQKREQLIIDREVRELIERAERNLQLSEL